MEILRIVEFLPEDRCKVETKDLITQQVFLMEMTGKEVAAYQSSRGVTITRPTQTATGLSSKFSLRHQFGVTWWAGERDGRGLPTHLTGPAITAEYRARAIVLLLDRINEFAEHCHPRVGMASDNTVFLEMDCPMDRVQELREKFWAWEQEVNAIPSFGSCLCPCGCKADLSVRECARQRLAVRDKVVVVNPPAFKIRDAVYPEHAEHGILGWATPTFTGSPYSDHNQTTVMACGCGAVLDISAEERGRFSNGDQMAYEGGPASEVLRKAVIEHLGKRLVIGMDPAAPKKRDPFWTDLVEQETLAFEDAQRRIGQSFYGSGMGAPGFVKTLREAKTLHEQDEEAKRIMRREILGEFTKGDHE